MTIPAPISTVHRSRASVSAPQAVPLASAPSPFSLENRAEAAFTLEGGESVLLARAKQGQRLTLTSRDGQPLLEYETHTGRVRVSGPITSLELDSISPDLELSAGGNLSLNASGRVGIRGGLGVSLEAGAAGAVPSAVAHLAPSGLSYAGGQLSLAAEVARLAFQRAEARGAELRATWSRVRLSSRAIEVEAHQLRSKAKSVFQEIEGSLTVKAGRVREWVRGSHHTRAERCEMRASGEVRIDGQRINLG